MKKLTQKEIDEKYKITYPFDTSDLYKWQQKRHDSFWKWDFRYRVIGGFLMFLVTLLLIILKATGNL